MTPLTLAELRMQQATLAHRAEKIRSEGRAVSAISPRALALARSAREIQARADEYAALLRVAEGMEP